MLLNVFFINNSSVVLLCQDDCLCALFFIYRYTFEVLFCHVRSTIGALSALIDIPSKYCFAMSGRLLVCFVCIYWYTFEVFAEVFTVYRFTVFIIEMLFCYVRSIVGVFHLQLQCCGHRCLHHRHKFRLGMT